MNEVLRSHYGYTVHTLHLLGQGSVHTISLHTFRSHVEGNKAMSTKSDLLAWSKKKKFPAFPGHGWSHFRHVHRNWFTDAMSTKNRRRKAVFAQYSVVSSTWVYCVRLVLYILIFALPTGCSYFTLTLNALVVVH